MNILYVILLSVLILAGVQANIILTFHVLQNVKAWKAQRRRETHVRLGSVAAALAVGERRAS